MRVHHLQHVPCEGLSRIDPILKEKGYHLTVTHLYNNQSLSSLRSAGVLIENCRDEFDGSRYVQTESEIYPYQCGNGRRLGGLGSATFLTIMSCSGSWLAD